MILPNDFYSKIYLTETSFSFLTLCPSHFILLILYIIIYKAPLVKCLYTVLSAMVNHNAVGEDHTII